MKHLTMLLAMMLALTVIPALALAHCGKCGMDANPAAAQNLAAMHQGHTDAAKGDMAHDDAGMHKGMEGHDHSGMAATGNMLDLGEKSEHGVKAMAHLKDVRAAMGKMGMKTTHHFMIMFNDDKSGKAIEAGTVAVKIVAPDGTTTGPLELMGMQGHFGADVILDQPGEYRFQVGSKLADNKTRQYEFKTVIK